MANAGLLDTKKDHDQDKNKSKNNPLVKKITKFELIRKVI